jgi:hypothetical protein
MLTFDCRRMNNLIRKAAFIFAVFISVFSSQLNAQVYDSVLKVLDSRYPQEKLYLHFDRSYYNPGETIWFKAYIFAANLPSEISKTVYADLIDENGKVISRNISPVVMSSAAGSFEIPANITSSNVYLRAYTDWMLNFDSSFIYTKAIPVLQPKKTTAKVVPKDFLQFFPESGDLVQGVESRVAFKATDVHGLPYKASGEVFDSKGKPVAKFSAAHDGMGFFTLAPAANEKYKAVWKDTTGKTQQTSLPAAKKEGYVLRLDQNPGGITFGISRPDAGENQVEHVTIVGQVQQQLVYMATANVSKGKTVQGVIPTENIPAGILQLTLFSADRQPLAERIIFVNKQDYYFITDLNNPLKSTEKRKKNVIQIDVPDTIHTNLSVAITDADVNPQLPGESDIFSGVLLTSDLKGYIHNPAYYFSSEADSVAKHLDLVMMTNGWRRFKWEDALAGKFPVIRHLPSNYLTINGKINGLTRTELQQKELTGILEINKKQEFMTIPVGPDGTFSVPGLVFFDTAKLYYQFNNDKEKVLTSRGSFDIRSNLFRGRLDVKSDSGAMYHTVLPPKDVWAKNEELAEKNQQVLDARRKVQTLQAVTVTAKKKTKAEEMDERYTSGLFSRGDAYTFVLDDDISAKGALSVLNYLQGKVAGLQITGAGQQASMSWRGGSPTLFLNEMQTDVGMVESLTMADIAMIKVFRPPFFGATGGGSGGAIAVYTKKGGDMRNSSVKGLDFANIPGYSVQREFYSPDYSKYDDRHADADYRTTLYWNPYVLTDKNSRRIFYTFYNNDVTRRFRVIIEGCNTEGKLTRIEKIFE